MVKKINEKCRFNISVLWGTPIINLIHTLKCLDHFLWFSSQSVAFLILENSCSSETLSSGFVVLYPESQTTCRENVAIKEVDRYEDNKKWKLVLLFYTHSQNYLTCLCSKSDNCRAFASNTITKQYLPSSVTWDMGFKEHALNTPRHALNTQHKMEPIIRCNIR